MDAKIPEWLALGFYAVISLSVPYALLYLIPFKLKFFEEKKPSEIWEELSFVDRFSLATLLFNFFIATFLLFSSSVLYCFFGVKKIYPILREFRYTSCFFLEQVLSGILFLIFGYTSLGLFRRAGFLFSFPVFLITLGGWIIIVIDLFKSG